MSEKKKPEKIEYYICMNNPVSNEATRRAEGGSKEIKDAIDSFVKCPGHFCDKGIVYKIQYTPVKRITIKRNVSVDIVEEEL